MTRISSTPSQGNDNHPHIVESERRMAEEIEIDDELLRQYRRRYVCLFTFKAGVKSGSALRSVRSFLEDVQRAELTDLSWIAVVDESPYEGPFLHVMLAGIKGAFRDHVTGFNRSAGHCHLLHSGLKAGVRIGYSETEHPGIASFRSALQAARFGVESELYRGGKHIATYEGSILKAEHYPF
jgi:hypothetical protein